MNPEEYLTFLEMAFEDNAENNPDLPVWVRSILSKLENSVLKEFAIISEGDPDNPADAGFAIGAVRHLKNTFDEKLAELENIFGMKLDPEDLAEMEDELSSLDDFKQDKIHEIEDANQSDFSAFYANLAKGSQSLYTEDNQLKHGSLDSEISLFMLMSWPHIEHNMKTRKDCYYFLIEKLGEQRVGSYERLGKYFQRIRSRPVRVGRPKQP